MPTDSVHQEGISPLSASPSPASQPASEFDSPTGNAATQVGQNRPLSEQILPPGGNSKQIDRSRPDVSDINAYVQDLQRDFQFKIDMDLGATVISVVDSETKKVIRQISSEQLSVRPDRLDQAEQVG